MSDSKLDNALVARAAPPGSMRYFAWLYTPPAQRDVLAALFLVELELHETARAPHDVAHVRLEWWRKEVERLIADHAQHPAMQVLQAERSGRIDLDRLQGAVHAAAQELANATYESHAELDRYFANGMGALFAVAAQYLCPAPPSPELLEAAAKLGAFVRRAETLRDIRQDAHRGRLYLPLTQLKEARIEYQALCSADWPTALRSLLRLHCTEQLDSYRELKRALLDRESHSLRPLLVLSELHAGILRKLARDPAQAAVKRVELNALEKPWIAWRSARGAR